MFMGGHSQGASLGEINFMNLAISLNDECSCGDKLRACAQWQKVFDAIWSLHGIDLIKHPYAFRLWDAIAVAIHQIDSRHQTSAYRLAVNLRKAWVDVRNHLPYNLREYTPIPPVLVKALRNKMDLYRAVSRCWDKSVIVDSSKNFREAVELYRRWPDLVRVILLTRDGRGTYLSSRSSGHSRSNSVNAWLSYYRRSLPLLESHIAQSSLLKMRYEDLASDPERVSRTLCAFVGISFEPGMINLAQTTRHLVAGNDTRFAPQKGIRLDERWRTELLGEELDFFERAGGDMNRRLGYY